MQLEFFLSIFVNAEKTNTVSAFGVANQGH